MPRRTLALVLAMLALGAVCVRFAWLGDDAYITLRTVENWVSGNGLRWNAIDRVQTFTHPLWMLLLSVGRWLTGEVYFTTIAVSLLLSLLAASMLLRRATAASAVVAVAIVLVGTRAFVDYTTSGLETPLTYVLLAAFVATVAGERPPGERCVRAVLLSSLLATNRMDLALLCAPAVASLLLAPERRTWVPRAVLATLPFVLWIAAAIVWFGSPFPVTAHAKAFGLGIPAGDVMLQGLRYAGFALGDDPVLLPAVAVGIGIGLASPRTRWLAAGALLYCCYVIRVGGDFMAGRFFLPPFVVAVAIVAPWLSQRPSRAIVAAAAAVLLAALGGVPQWLRGPASDVQPTDAELLAQHGIGDERRVYCGKLGLLSPTRSIPEPGALEKLPFPEGRTERWVLLNGAVGVAGYQTPPRGVLVDALLCDPLLARLPARDPSRWRIGHVVRRVPEGYYETIASGENRLRHPRLRAYHDALCCLTQAPVLSFERFATIVRMLTGGHADDLRAYVADDYYTPPRVDVAVAELPADVKAGTYWFDDLRVRVVYDGGLAVRLAAARSARSLRVQTSGLFAFRFRFVRGGQVVGDAMAERSPQPPDVVGLRAVAGLRTETVAVPAGVAAFDTVWIDAVETAETHLTPVPAAIGALTFVD